MLATPKVDPSSILEACNIEAATQLTILGANCSLRTKGRKWWQAVLQAEVEVSPECLQEMTCDGLKPKRARGPKEEATRVVHLISGCQDSSGGVGEDHIAVPP